MLQGPHIMLKNALLRHKLADTNRISSFVTALQLNKFQILVPDQNELAKCLYPVSPSQITIAKNSQSISYHSHSLAAYGASIMALHVNKMLLQLFKNKTYDINGKNFNYLQLIDNRKLTDSNHLVKSFLKTNNITRLSHLPLPMDRIPTRIQRRFDVVSFHSIIGYLALSNDVKAIDTFIEKSIMPGMVKFIL